MRAVGIIPARMESRRLPGKPLLEIAGRPMVEWVWRRASFAKSLEGVFIATDSAEIARAAEGFGCRAIMTSPHCATGTDRVASAVKQLEDEGISPRAVVNIQGDEPLIEPELIDALVEPLLGAEPPDMLTAATINPDLEELNHPAVCKVVCDSNGRALYFSRSLIPQRFRRGKPREDGEVIYLRHIGIYAYRGDFLATFTELPQSPLERFERLEMLRALEHGYQIKVVKTEYRSIGVDTEEQLARVRKLFARQNLGERILSGG